MVLPVIAAAWKMTPAEVGWLISGGFLGQMIGAIGFGQLAERVGRIPAIMVTTAVFALGGIASAFAWGFLSMQAIRFVQGLGLGAEVPIAAAYINEIAPAERRGRFVLLYEILFAIGLLLAGVIGRWVIPAWGWQSLFLIGSVPPLIAVLLIPTLPEIAALADRPRPARCRLRRRGSDRNRHHRRRPDIAGAGAEGSPGRQPSWSLARAVQPAIPDPNAGHVGDLADGRLHLLAADDLAADDLRQSVSRAARNGPELRHVQQLHHYRRRDRLCITDRLHGSTGVVRRGLVHRQPRAHRPGHHGRQHRLERLPA